MMTRPSAAVLISFSSFMVAAGCASGGSPTQDILGARVMMGHPGVRQVTSAPRLPVYVYPHQSPLGDLVSGAWLAIADPRP
jgi:hypothetical protein